MGNLRGRVMKIQGKGHNGGDNQEILSLLREITFTRNDILLHSQSIIIIYSTRELVQQKLVYILSCLYNIFNQNLLQTFGKSNPYIRRKEPNLYPLGYRFITVFMEDGITLP